MPLLKLKNMKKNTLSLALIVLSFFFTQAQNGYNYTLVSDGYNSSTSTYDFRIQAVPFATSTSTITPKIQSYGFTIIIPDGGAYDLQTTTLIGSSSITVNPFAESVVDLYSNGIYSGHKGYLITDTLTNPIVLASTPASLNPVDMMQISISGNPTSGEVRLIANNASLSINLKTLGFDIDSYLLADMLDENVFSNQIETNPNSGLTGSENYLFSTLSIGEHNSLEQFSLYPNPTKGDLFIKANEAIEKVEIYNGLGQNVLTVNASIVNTANLSSGMYLLKITTDSGKTSIKRFIKE